ncbi:DNA polymerase III [Caldifermentibacillus hisashii]|uniref:DNA polymerase III n=1 Tax=Caldifermentibacillus hisashii TaxID=996558 RepID=A0ABU9JYB3_9BACI|nr:DNA polymerase III [Caldibacillus thermoamylovorans]MCM3055708.1 DNA polymerase III [Caldibacillus thermoamylovorans]
MSNLLYHAYLPENHEHHVSLEEVMSGGIKYSTKSNNRYSNGGRVKFEITELLRPSNIPDWLNFKEAIGVDLSNRFSKSFCFPIFTDKILVFDGDISLSIYDQAFYEDFKDFDEEALNFDTGETIEYWVKLYWKSMMLLEDYLIKKPYSKPEVLIFESVPKEIIQVCEK